MVVGYSICLLIKQASATLSVNPGKSFYSKDDRVLYVLNFKSIKAVVYEKSTLH